ncbi:hypothetical protein J7K42_02660 [bacterium]|nr:hypothetical protein [bacterium]
MKSKLIILFSILIVLFVAIGIFFWSEKKRGPIYLPVTPDLKNCIVEEIETPAPYQKVCLNKKYPLPSKVYFQDGWKVICCSNLNNK